MPGKKIFLWLFFFHCNVFALWSHVTKIKRRNNYVTKKNCVLLFFRLRKSIQLVLVLGGAAFIEYIFGFKLFSERPGRAENLFLCSQQNFILYKTKWTFKLLRLKQKLLLPVFGFDLVDLFFLTSISECS